MSAVRTRKRDHWAVVVDPPLDGSTFRLQHHEVLIRGECLPEDRMLVKVKGSFDIYGAVVVDVSTSHIIVRIV